MGRRTRKKVFSIVDVIGVLTDQSTKRGATFYWSKLKQRLKEEGSELLTNCQQLKMVSEDGKKRATENTVKKLVQLAK